MSKGSERRILSILIQRIDASIEAGVLDVQWELSPRAEPVVCITDGELARLLMIMFPNDYPDRPFPRPEPTSAPPGSPRKVAELERRATLGLSLYHPQDADSSSARSASRGGQGTRNDLAKIE